MRRMFAIVVGVLALLGGAAQGATDRSAAARGAEWLLKADAEGGGNAADAVVALRAAGRLSDPEATRRAAALRSGAAAYADTPGAAAKTILGLVAAGSGNPRCAGGIDLLARITRGGLSGRYGRSAWDQALGMTAIKALGRRPPRAAARFLLATRGSGGWNYTLSRTARDDVTHTALAIIGLRAAGVKSSDRGLRAGVRWLLSQRTPGGGFGHQRRDRNEANATALAIEALRSVGRSDARAAHALRGLQRPDGSFQLAASEAGSRPLATVDAVVALSGKTVPVGRLSRPARSC